MMYYFLYFSLTNIYGTCVVEYYNDLSFLSMHLSYKTKTLVNAITYFI